MNWKRDSGQTQLGDEVCNFWHFPLSIEREFFGTRLWAQMPMRLFVSRGKRLDDENTWNSRAFSRISVCDGDLGKQMESKRLSFGCESWKVKRFEILDEFESFEKAKKLKAPDRKLNFLLLNIRVSNPRLYQIVSFSTLNSNQLAHRLIFNQAHNFQSSQHKQFFSSSNLHRNIRSNIFRKIQSRANLRHYIFFISVFNFAFRAA